MISSRPESLRVGARMTDHAIPSQLASLLERLEGHEALDLEFKAARGGLPRDIWPTVSAFANTAGGWIILGVAEREGRTMVDGVAHPTDLLQRFTDQVRNAQKLSHPVCGAMDTTVEEVNGERVAVIRVPAAPRKNRPVYIDGNPYTGTFVRRNTGDYRCTKPEVDRMMREASDVAADSRVLSHLGWDDLDRNTFRRYRQRYQSADASLPQNGYDDDTFLHAIGGYRHDHESGRRGITLAGLLMFGTPQAIREQRSRHLIDFRKTSVDSEASVGWDDRVVWEGNLLGAFEAIYPRLVADVPVPFALQHEQRIDQSPLHTVLREALVNLLVHADYAETDASLILRSDSGYEFRNPGSSRVLETDLLIGDRSDPRNPELVRMFRFIRLAEEAGTGIPRIRQTWRALGFQSPNINVGTERYEFSLRLRHAHLLSEDDRQWLDLFGYSWSEAEQLALILARHEHEIDNPTLRRMTGQHPSDITKVLGVLRDRGLLQMIGGGRGARYRLADDVPLSSDEAEWTVAATKTNTSSPNRQTALLPPSSLDLGVSTAESSESSAHSVELLSDVHSRSSLVAQPIWHELEAIAKPVSAFDYVSAGERDKVVIDLCALQPLALLEVAWLLGRNKAYVRTILKQLVDKGELAYLYPERPRHPHQRYKTVRKASTE